MFKVTHLFHAEETTMERAGEFKDRMREQVKLPTVRKTLLQCARVMAVTPRPSGGVIVLDMKLLTSGERRIREDELPLAEAALVDSFEAVAKGLRQVFEVCRAKAQPVQLGGTCLSAATASLATWLPYESISAGTVDGRLYARRAGTVAVARTFAAMGLVRRV